MQISPQIQLLIDSVQKERDEAYTKFKTADKLLKQLKDGDYSFLNGHASSNTAQNLIEANNIDSSSKKIDFPIKGDTKIQILTIIDLIGKACKLREIQDSYKNLTGTNPNLRESVRTLNRAGKILLMKVKGARRGSFWVKSEWVENGVLLPKYKFDGFDLLYDDDDLEFTQHGDT